MGKDDVIESIFGWVGSAISIYFFISPAVPFSKVLKEEMNYKDSPGVLLISSFINCILWADYGLLKDITQIYLTNSLGGTITLIWISIYIFYFGRKYFSFSLIINIILLVVSGIISYLFYYKIDEKITGLVAMIFNILMYASPGEKIFKIIKTGNYHLIPIFSTIGGFACSLCWLIFGIYKEDKNVIIPNALGLFFSILQSIIYFIYYYKNNGTSKNIKTNDK